VTPALPALRPVVAAALLVLVSACSGGNGPASTSPSLQPDLPGKLAGESTEFTGPMALREMSARALRIRYHSTSGIDESRTVVTGLVFVPKGAPPEGGWPIAAVGHATTGMNSSCAPSLYPGLMGGLTSAIPFLANGFLVVMPDYQGLGTPDVHPYLEPRTAAYNVIDAVRAAHYAVEDVSDVWVGYGVSQGGQAVWAANELAPEYGRNLRLLGSISMAAPTDLRPLVNAMVDGTLTDEQKVLVPMVLSGVQSVHPDLNLDDYLSGEVRKSMDVFLSCAGEQDALRSKIVENAPATDFAPVTPVAAEQLRTWLGEFSLPQRQASAPMLVGYGEDDRLIPPAWTEAAVRQACGMGDIIDAHLAPGQGHGILNFGSLPAEWLGARLAGDPPPSTCATTP
jgi:pimeloyl-ACP methyl ester carboxylesterase